MTNKLNTLEHANLQSAANKGIDCGFVYSPSWDKANVRQCEI